MDDIFISYAREDRGRAERLARRLRDKGFSVWWDRKIVAGKAFDEVIQSALDGAKCVIVLWSKLSVRSHWVKEEAEIGAERGILVPVLIDDVPIPLGFGRFQTASLVGWDGEAEAPVFRDLLSSINAAITGEPHLDSSTYWFKSVRQQIDASELPVPPPQAPKPPKAEDEDSLHWDVGPERASADLLAGESRERNTESRKALLRWAAVLVLAITSGVGTYLYASGSLGSLLGRGEVESEPLPPPPPVEEIVEENPVEPAEPAVEETAAEEIVQESEAEARARAVLQLAELKVQSADAGVEDADLLSGYEELWKGARQRLDAEMTLEVARTIESLRGCVTSFEALRALEEAGEVSPEELLESWRGFEPARRLSPAAAYQARRIAELEEQILQLEPAPTPPPPPPVVAEERPNRPAEKPPADERDAGWAEIASDELFLTCRDVRFDGNKPVGPIGATERFRPGPVYVFAWVKSPRSRERLKIEWVFEGEVEATREIRISRNMGAGYRIAYSMTYPEAGRGEVRLYNEAGERIARRRFRIVD